MHILAQPCSYKEIKRYMQAYFIAAHAIFMEKFSIKSLSLNSISGIINFGYYKSNENEFLDQRI